MEKKTTLLLLLTCVMSFTVKSQTLYRTYYDYEKAHVKEEYYANSYGVKNGLYKEHSEYGGILQQGTYKNDIMIGQWITKDEKGILLQEDNYDNEGKYNGLVTKYKDGYKYIQESYKHGLKDGHWKTWFLEDEQAYDAKVYLKPDGKPQIKVDEYYKNDVNDSIYTEYFLNSKIKSQEHYKNGVLNGDCVHYDDAGSGEIMYQGKFKDGKPLGNWRITFDNNWKITSDKSNAAYYRLINYSDDRKWKATDYYITGEIQGEETMIQTSPDIMIGSAIGFYKNGQYNFKEHFNANGNEDSIGVEYYQNGQIAARVKYVNGNRDSTLVEFYDNGKIYTQGECKDNKRIGVWKIWDKNGNLIFMQDFSTEIGYSKYHFYKNGQEVNTSEATTDGYFYVAPFNSWPWPNDNLIELIKEFTQ